MNTLEIRKNKKKFQDYFNLKPYWYIKDTWFRIGDPEGNYCEIILTDLNAVFDISSEDQEFKKYYTSNENGANKYLNDCVSNLTGFSTVVNHQIKDLKKIKKQVEFLSEYLDPYIEYESKKASFERGLVDGIYGEENRIAHREGILNQE